MKPANNIDAARLAMALIVLLAHAAQLSRAPALAWIPTEASTLAVQGFFALSGFLMVGSFERSGSIAAFFRRRVLRLYPAYAAAVVITSMVLVAATSSASAVDWLRYLAANVAMANWLHPGVRGLFADNPIDAINGSLWSMKFEVCCYLGVPVLFAAARRAGWAGVLLTAYAAAADFGRLIPGHLAQQVPAILGAFLTGVAVARWAPLIDRHRVLVLAAAALVLTLHVSFAEPAALAVLVLAVARAPRVVHVTRWGDLSYGVYLTHFPVIQALVAAGCFAAAPGASLVTSVAAALLLAAALWRWVERPAIAAGAVAKPAPARRPGVLS